MRRAGQYVRNTYLVYLVDNAVTHIKSATSAHSRDQVSVQSIDTDVGHESAHHLISGMYNSNDLFVPVTSPAIDTDFLLLGHSDCPHFDQEISVFHASAAFATKITESEVLRTKALALATTAINSTETISEDLSDIYRLYDILSTTDNQDVLSQVNDTLVQLERLTTWVEFAKFSSKKAITTATGRMLDSVLNHFRDIQAHVEVNPNSHLYQKMKVYSADYTVLVPLLTHIDTGVGSFDILPSPASLVAFEYYRNNTVQGATYQVRAVLRESDQRENGTATHVFPNATVGDNAHALPIPTCQGQQFCDWA
ncbi:hypothetical protein SARC_11495 [Sphaeroforma arctica JP610]|uniref:Uncharacterized protein n=1 Tax=Sphaeroforma arctica JP610 TaxID=667725 RepID=A0A0L0FGT9_9EUKA|nr:hypothetical protein SARC_11495 [Sphaeroforma arctica JP610]KNC75994.1 hypothetical protein SARC_11495 [Sphaeroforma arctica JP610]|eukprot:XP_014149896.1 hypothetical protein SARC_11495 [Sphaeroforma arctica JP610]